MPQTYASPEAFKQAVERRIRTAAGAPGMGRFRQVLVFDRFLARMFEHFGERAIVKGGVVLELRLERARTTRDVDIRLSGSGDRLLSELEAIGRLDLGDFLSFTVEPDRDHPTIEGDGMVYEGQRFRVQAMLAGKGVVGSTAIAPTRVFEGEKLCFSPSSSPSQRDFDGSRASVLGPSSFSATTRSRIAGSRATCDGTGYRILTGTAKRIRAGSAKRICAGRLA